MQKSVIIATPDRLQRNRIVPLVEKLPEYRIVACTADLMNTYNEVEERLPKAVLISDVLADLPEFEVMRALFATLDVRWMVMTSARRGVRGRMRDLVGRATGAELFSISADATPDVFAQQLSALTRTERNALPAAKPVAARQPAFVPRARAGVAETGSPAYLPQRPLTVAPASPVVSVPMSRIRTDGEGHVILIGASTGGVDALLTVLSRFPADCPPTLVVQHTGVGFGESLAGLLNRQCLPQVRLATGSETIVRGQVLVGAGTRAHLVLHKGSATRAALLEEGPVSGHLPSVDMLFRSAVAIAPRVSAALLTGMGRDGAAGMRALCDAGAYTIAQDEASCVIYGMPRAAVECGGAREVLPLDRIGDALLAVRTPDRSHGREMQK